jgi:hypothetical protein
MNVRTILLTAVFLMVFSLPAIGSEDDLQTLSSDLSVQEIDERSRFIEERLDAGRTHAAWWQYGWGGFYTVTMVTSAVSASNQNGDDAGDDRLNNGVNAAKSALGLVDRIFRPLPGRSGADGMRAMPNTTRAEKLARLARGEKELRETARRSDDRKSLMHHLQIVGVNLLGGAIVAAWGDTEDAIISTVGGIAMGQVVTWTQPWQPVRDLEDYERGFTHARNKLHWKIVPMRFGAMLQVDF